MTEQSGEALTTTTRGDVSTEHSGKEPTTAARGDVNMELSDEAPTVTRGDVGFESKFYVFCVIILRVFEHQREYCRC